MDMVLYSMVKKEIENAPKDKVDNVCGYEIRFVTSVPNQRDTNTIYFVLGQGNNSDGIVIGKQGLSSIVFENNNIDFGVLNGNVFFNRYDDNRGIGRQLFDVTAVPIICDNSASYNINLFNIKGNGACIINNVILGETTVPINKEFVGVYNGICDEVDLLTGTYIKRMDSTVIDQRITWTTSGTSGDYRIYRASSYTGSKPDILGTNGLYNSSSYQPITKENSMILNSNFVTTTSGDVNKECIYVNNGVLYLRIKSSTIAEIGGSSYVASLQTYLRTNPITVYLTKTEEIVEQIGATEFIAPDDVTEINVDYAGDCPRIIVEIPIKK